MNPPNRDGLLRNLCRENRGAIKFDLLSHPAESSSILRSVYDVESVAARCGGPEDGRPGIRMISPMTTTIISAPLLMMMSRTFSSKSFATPYAFRVGRGRSTGFGDADGEVGDARIFRLLEFLQPSASVVASYRRSRGAPDSFGDFRTFFRIESLSSGEFQGFRWVFSMVSATSRASSTAPFPPSRRPCSPQSRPPFPCSVRRPGRSLRPYRWRSG